MASQTPIEWLKERGCVVVSGAQFNTYRADDDVIALTEETARGTNPRNWLDAFHELAHQEQTHEWFWRVPVIRRFTPMRQWLEIRAWQRSAELLEQFYS